MNKKRWTPWAMILGAFALPLAGLEVPAFTGAVELRVDDLKTPLGIDDPSPRFSWQLRDPARGAKQSAYEVRVSSQPELLRSDAANPDVWDSGRIESGKSLNVRYGGPAVTPGTRYFWQVKLWDAAGKPYAESEVSWWETGLLKQENWRAKWIGYETAEEDAVRHAPALWIANPDALTGAKKKGGEQHIAYRETVTLAKPVKRAVLYATAQDTVSAWVNGEQVLTAESLPAWKHMPWKKFVRAEVSGELSLGANSIAVEQVHYFGKGYGAAKDDAPPLNATLFVEYADGTTGTFTSGTDWMTTARLKKGKAATGWHENSFDDRGWKNAVAWKQNLKPDDDPLGHPWLPDSVKSLRHSFTVEKPVKSARLYATALGAYLIGLNEWWGTGDQVLAPGWTDYREHVYYQTYDVTAQIRQGKNAMSALLAPGWYATPLQGEQQPNNYGVTPPALRAQLRIEHTDSSVEWVVTDESWQASGSHILHSELYDGETMNPDPNEQWVGISSPEFDDSWFHARAIVIHPAPVQIEAQDFQPIRVERTLKAVALTEPKPGVWVYDFGQDLTGIETLDLHNGEKATVRMRFAEVLNPDGMLYTDNLRTAKSTDTFILGTGHVIITPFFTFHGFRYAELTGFPRKPDIDAVKANVLHTDAAFTDKLDTSSAMINKLWSNILWGQRSNFVGVPTDCPQRDERLGWMADAQVFWRTASFNMDLAAFTRKYAGDMRGTQAGTPYYGVFAPGTIKESSGSGAAWSDAGVIIPWTSWLQNGDTSVIDENWAAMEKFLDAIEAANPDGLRKKDAGSEFGDWLSPEGKTNYTLLATALWAYDATLMRQMAHATDRAQAEEKYARLFDKIRAAFQKEFVRADGFVAGADNGGESFGGLNNPNAKSKGGDTQTGYVLALHMNLLPEDLRAAAAQRLVDKIKANDGLLGTGFVGTAYLLEELTRSGHADVAYQLLLNTRYPSWGYEVEHGATTMWERWNGDKMRDDPTMNSYNHYAYGAVGDWIYRYAAGVDATPLDAGFHTVALHPVFNAQLGSIAFDYDSAYGRIHSDWKVQGTTTAWHVTIPANTTGWLKLSAEEAAKYTLEGVLLKQSKLAKAATRGQESGFELAAGSYSFSVEF